MKVGIKTGAGARTFRKCDAYECREKGLLSDLYTDIERDERIRTYSFPISETLYVFLDIPYAYLYEQEGLL